MADNVTPQDTLLNLLDEKLPLASETTPDHLDGDWNITGIDVIRFDDSGSVLCMLGVSSVDSTDSQIVLVQPDLYDKLKNTDTLRVGRSIALAKQQIVKIETRTNAMRWCRVAIDLRFANDPVRSDISSAGQRHQQPQPQPQQHEQHQQQHQHRYEQHQRQQQQQQHQQGFMMPPESPAFSHPCVNWSMAHPRQLRLIPSQYPHRWSDVRVEMAPVEMVTPKLAILPRNQPEKDITKIANIKPGRLVGRKTLRVRVSKVTPMRTDSYGTRYIIAHFVDETGEIRCVARSAEARDLLQLLLFGAAYDLSGVLVRPIDENFGPQAYKYELNYDWGGNIERCKTDVEPTVARTTMFNHLVTLSQVNVAPLNSFVDVVCVVIGNSGIIRKRRYESESDDKDPNRRLSRYVVKNELALVDRAKRHMNFTLWLREARELSVEGLQRAPTIAIRHAKVKRYHGLVYMSAVRETAYMFNPTNVPEAESLDRWFREENGLQSTFGSFSYRMESQEEFAVSDEEEQEDMTDE